MNECVDCDDCEFRSETCLCELSENEDECPLGLFYDFQSCVIGIDAEERPILSYEKMVLLIAENENLTIEESKEYIDFNVVRMLDYAKSSIIIMYERGK